MLDEQANKIFAMIDDIAERVRKIGATTLRSIGDLARRRTIADKDASFVTAWDVLSELHSESLALVEGFRAAKGIADQAGNNPSSLLIDDWTDAAVWRAWFRRAARCSSTT
ncbi:hypothetical protein KXR53_15010 [Inquilinus limosus]|uniref:hypothetical protein n=1 Tax=Inquilinus limosus TaxID=171674 RepID=UPI003F1728A4